MLVEATRICCEVRFVGDERMKRLNSSQYSKNLSYNHREMAYVQMERGVEVQAHQPHELKGGGFDSPRSNETGLDRFIKKWGEDWNKKDESKK
jgi:hypothetical protein